MSAQHRYAEVVHMWLWWSVYTLGRRAGYGSVEAFKAAQRAVARLYA